MALVVCRSYILILAALIAIMFLLLFIDFRRQWNIADSDEKSLTKVNLIPLNQNQKQNTNTRINSNGNAIEVADDILDHDDAHEHMHRLSIVKDGEWGHIYSPVRIICMVPTLWPKKKYTMKAIAETWGKRCDKLFFVVDDTMSHTVPDTFHGAHILKLHLEHPQSSGDRNIWEKVWKMWFHMGQHHLYDAEWFFKVDDDSFLSAVNFKGFVRYYNPDREYYMGHTLMHAWSYKNVVFNSGTCYALSRGSLRKVYPIFSTDEFQHDRQRSASKNYCVHRSGDQEDPTMALCLRSVGINPTNTLSMKVVVATAANTNNNNNNNKEAAPEPPATVEKIIYQERFLPFRPGDHAEIEKKNSWFWRHKHPSVGFYYDCCSAQPVSFHNYKKNPSKLLKELDDKYNSETEESDMNGKNQRAKVFTVPRWQPRTFVFNEKGAPAHDEWFNVRNGIPRGQRIYQGKGHERTCHECARYDIKTSGFPRAHPEYDYFYNLMVENATEFELLFSSTESQ